MDPAGEAAAAPGAWRSAGAIWRALAPRRRRQLGWTVALMVVGAGAELATVGAVLPFLAVATGDAGGRFASLVAATGALAGRLGVTPIACAAAVLILVAIAAAAVRLELIRRSQDAVFGVAHDLATRIYDRTLHQPYAFHVRHNSSRLLAGIEQVQFLLGNVLLPAMAGLTAAVVALAILAGMIAIDPVTSLVAAACFLLFYLVVGATTRRRLYANADLIAGAVERRVRMLQEGLGGIRDVALDRSQAIHVDAFVQLDRGLRRAQAANQLIAAAPRYLVEAGGVVLIAIITLFVTGRQGGLLGALPTLGALALGAQRLLPLAQQAYFSWSQVHGNRAALAEVARLLAMPPPPAPSPHPVPPLAREIQFDHVSFAYAPDTPPALRQISLHIPRGARVGLVGRSGSGKSTLADLLMGLLEPSDGAVRIDGRALDTASLPSWQAQVAHVPQAIFLADASIAANIAFGRDAGGIDMARVRDAAAGAELAEFVAGLADGYETVVGERGVRLSGGQRQRIGIARALYKQASVLVLDEATSALDDATEDAVMAAIAKLPRDLTIVSIAHRVSTLRGCDMLVRLVDGRVAAVGSYAELVGAERAEA